MTLDQKLWFRLFNHSAICDFSHLHAPSEKYRSSELQESLKQDFKCHFPFFWIVKEKIDSQIQDYTIGMNGNRYSHIKNLVAFKEYENKLIGMTVSKILHCLDMKQAHSDIFCILSLTPLAEALCIIPADEEELDKYCEMYLADFLKCVLNMTRSNTEVNDMEMEVYLGVWCTLQY